MNEKQQSQSLADQALERLRKLAKGNGLDPKTIAVFDVQEQSVTLKGRIFVSPLCDTESLSYPGDPRGRERRKVSSFAELQKAVERHREEFMQRADWADSVVEQIKTHETKGWGLQNAKVTLPERSLIFAATELCPACSGRGTQICQRCLGRGMFHCVHCEGRGRELCYHCMGKGEDPQTVGQRCHMCQGTLYVPCRFCQMRGHVPCPSCGGKGIPCTSCGGTGKFTQEVKVTCGVQTRFAMDVNNLPSGLRKGLDRIGLERLGTGHADIETAPPHEEEKTPDEPLANKPVLNYTAMVPYAEMKMNIGGKKAVVSAVGKRCVITGVPPFLDGTLKPWIDRLRRAARGKGSFQEALQARALNEILSLVVAGKGTEREVRRLYPFGLSSGVVADILSTMKLAIQRSTLVVRALASVFSVALSAAFFFFLFHNGWEARFTKGLSAFANVLVDIGFLAAALLVSWGILNFSARFALQRRFPQSAFALRQKTGNMGIAMFAAIVAAFAAAIWLAPVKPFWYMWLLVKP